MRRTGLQKEVLALYRRSVSVTLLAVMDYLTQAHLQGTPNGEIQARIHSTQVSPLCPIQFPSECNVSLATRCQCNRTFATCRKAAVGDVRGPGCKGLFHVDGYAQLAGAVAAGQPQDMTPLYRSIPCNNCILSSITPTINSAITSMRNYQTTQQQPSDRQHRSASFWLWASSPPRQF